MCVLVHACAHIAINANTYIYIIQRERFENELLCLSATLIIPPSQSSLLHVEHQDSLHCQQPGFLLFLSLCGEILVDKYKNFRNIA